MKIRICKTIDLSSEQVTAMVIRAKTCGHGYDHVTNAKILIRRMLESEIEDAATYCHERNADD